MEPYGEVSFHHCQVFFHSLHFLLVTAQLDAGRNRLLCAGQSLHLDYQKDYRLLTKITILLTGITDQVFGS